MKVQLASAIFAIKTVQRTTPPEAKRYLITHHTGVFFKLYEEISILHFFDLFLLTKC